MKHAIYSCDIHGGVFLNPANVRGGVSIDDGDTLNNWGNVCDGCTATILQFIQENLAKNRLDGRFTLRSIINKPSVEKQK